MTDYQAEQEMEIEALEAILQDDLQEVTDSVPSGWKPVGKVWRVVVAPQQEDGEEAEYPVRAELVFAHTASYPDEAPLFKARGLQGLSDADVAQLQGLLEEQVAGSLGMAMIYTLIGAAQEWISDKAAAVAAPSLSPEEEERRRREVEEERLAELRRHGTPVTPEAFAEWKARFAVEQRLAAAKVGADGGAAAAGGSKDKLTGKQWFMQQEAQHLEVEEPELQEDESDGEDERENWSVRGEEEEEEELDFEEESDDEGMLDALEASLAAKSSGAGA